MVAKISLRVGAAMLGASLLPSQVLAGVTNLETGENWWIGQDGDPMNEIEEWAEEQEDPGDQTTPNTIFPDHWDNAPIVTYQELGDVCAQANQLVDLSDPGVRAFIEAAMLAAGQAALSEADEKIEENILWIHFEAFTPELESFSCGNRSPWTSEVELTVPVEVKPWLSSTKSGDIRIAASLSTRNILVDGIVTSTQSCLEGGQVIDVDIPRLDGWIVNSLESALDDLLGSRLCF